jgi:hypothetical protein
MPLDVETAPLNRVAMAEEKSSQRHQLVWLTIFCILGASLVTWMFRDVLTGDATLAFRDVAHFYRPLYQYLGTRQADSWFPLWSRADGFGIPLAGEPTTALFYPPRLVLMLFPIDSAIACYVLLHLFIAGAGAFCLGRYAQPCSKIACVTAFSYPLSGCVFFLYTNPPFLVGAAWLPWILLGFARQTSLRTSVFLAMCVLGGEPQMAFHGVLIGSLWTLGQSLREFRSKAAKQDAKGQPLAPSGHCHRLLRFALTITFAIALSMPQIAASISWSSQSHRYATQPQHIGNLVASMIQSETTRPLPASPDSTSSQQTSHAGEIYKFSLRPWHLGELLSPFISGPLFPVNGRLSQLIPGEPGMWTPTIYCGFVPAVCLVISLGHRKRWSRWLVLAVVAMLIAFGQFGIYSLLVNLLPGYGQFRFPTKWLPIAALGISVHAAVVLGSSNASVFTSLTRSAKWISVGALLLCLATWLPFVTSSLQQLALWNPRSDRYWGPLDIETGLRNVRLSLTQTAIVAALFYGAMRWRSGQPVPPPRAIQALMVIALTDSIACAQWQLATIDNASTSRHAAETHFDSPRPSRHIITTDNNDAWPNEWRSESSTDRLSMVFHAEQSTLFMRWHLAANLAANVAVMNNSVSVASHRATVFWRTVNNVSRRLDPGERRQFVDNIAKYLSVDSVLRRKSGRLVKRAIESKQDFIRWHSMASLRSPVQADQLSAEIVTLLQQIQAIDAVPPLTIETHELPEPGSQETTPKEATPAEIRVTKDAAESIAMEVVTDQAGYAQIMQMQDGGWRAFVRRSGTESWSSIPVHRADYVTQAIRLPAGHWQVRLEYRPGWWWPSWIVAGSALTILLLLQVYPKRAINALR